MMKTDIGAIVFRFSATLLIYIIIILVAIHLIFHATDAQIEGPFHCWLKGITGGKK